MADPYIVLRIQGTLPGGEVWSVTPKFALVGTGPAVSYDTLLAWATAVGGLNSGNVLPVEIRAALSVVGFVDSLRAEYYGGSGVLNEVAEYVLPDPKAGTSTANKPFQVAVVSSLRTGRPGRSYSGRLYWPAISIALEPSSLRVNTATALSLATSVAAFLKAVQTAFPGPGAIRLAVVSQTLGVATEVTQIRVGDVLDTQRRRRDTLAEGYSNAVFPGP